MSQSKGTIFTQVTRTAAGDTSNPLDPLSVFALSQPAPTTAATEANNTKQESLQSDYLIVNKSSDLLEFKKEDLSVPRTFADALHNNSKNPSTATTRNNSSVDAPSPRFFRENKLMDSTSSVDYPGGSVSGDEVDRALQSVGDESEQDGAFRYMTGERKIISMVDVYLQLSPRDHLPGILFMTNYRVVFLVGNDVLRTLAAVNPSIESYLQVPLCSIDRIERERKHKDQNASTGVTILIICKEAKQHRITLRTTTSYKSTVQSRESEIERALSVLSAYAFPNNLQYAFAYSHKLQCKILDSFEPILEYSRQTVLDSNFWRVTTSNEEYRLCRSYPRVLIVPKTLTDDELAIIASFRSGQRLPVLCWGSKNSRATMWRSSQPKAGVSGSCLQDEKMLDIIAHSCAFNRTLAKSKSYTGEPVLHIVDLRSRTSAMANRATGAGYESHSNYPNCKLEFYGIPNIHVVRDSYRNICSTVLNPNANTATDLTFSKQVEDSQWLANLRLILKASWETAKFIARNQPVLVHCSHGWDRTSQVCGLAQLFLDPFYRTMAGFRILLEKEWCTFGHQFQMRCAHTQDRSVRKEDEMSPIFLQFLDCVWQVQHQSPHYFEFNSRYILTIADHIYSGRFGNFLHSCELDRVSCFCRFYFMQ